jgi:outer membrane protein assembly factor BamA
MMRLTGGASFGRDPEAFYVGGIDNWLNRGFEGGIRDDLRSISYGHFITPLRGVDYYEMDGDRYALANLEFRFPMLQYLLLGWPLPMGFANIRGAGFFDIGTAWYEKDSFRYDNQTGERVDVPAGFNMWKPKSATDSRDVLDDLRYGFGFGVRGALFFIPVRWDVAWSHNGLEFLGPRYLWSIGLEY